ncbi:MAG: Stk1 family PASTA domain-containing Ser/Thr kinase [Propionibacteriaceae bacterium]|jgi:serine/threonine-protein kinase|nr:Stk1 family PASTA domain-containing Ser/Thr kinase [Propionibacteriaceae bacterium]
MTETLLGDRYIVGPLLGRGGMAEVRRGRDIRLEREVAIKRLRPDLAGDDIFQARFRREAQASAGLNHPNIVSVYDTGEQFDQASGLNIPYIVMELVIGHTLRDILRDGRRIPPQRSLELVTSVLNALDYSHRHGIIHRDIKPANIMVTQSGQVKVMDFGIARAVSDTAGSMTQTAAVIGTPQYLSPEQIRGEPVDRRADIYATGCLLYELLTGRPPFQGEEPVSLAYQHVRELPQPPSTLNPAITPAMDAIVLKSLEKDPANRYQTAKEMADDISRLLTGQTVTATLTAITPSPGEADPTQVLPTAITPGAQPLAAEDEPTEEDEAAARKRKILIAVIASLAAVVAIVAGILIWWFMREPAPPVVTTVEVPYVQGMTETTALSTIEEAGLTTETIHQNGANDDTVGKVTHQEPSAKAQAEKGSRVRIWVNDGPQKGTIPLGLIGLDRASAEEALKAAGFTKYKIDPAPLQSYPYQSTYVADHIIDCDPAPGNTAAVDTVIQLYYDSGNGILPNVASFDQYRATQELTKAGFLNLTWQEQQSTSPAGTVVAMDPASGSMIARNAPVTVWLATPPVAPSTSSEPSRSASASAPSASTASVPG